MGVKLPPLIGSEAATRRFDAKEKFIKAIRFLNVDDSSNEIGIVALSIVNDMSQNEREQELKERPCFGSSVIQENPHCAHYNEIITKPTEPMENAQVSNV